MTHARTTCRIEAVFGRADACPPGRCALWQPGTVERCASEHVEPVANDDADEWLREMRRTVELLHR
jgi:hypothetical protein